MTTRYVIPGSTGNLMIDGYGRKVATKLDDIDALVARSNGLLKACRAYLRTVQERIDKLEEE